ncbi:hypothetical protein BIV57_05220 [Mangrovactinospora gilvigrisea]|uniref:Uncharacterized protein n=2 Tax=Mangrovactinospora gilvigrisea TaxID=1428644 RepID=A0A1J7CAJ7_9ACTN|nr:hypothetical protein BIV57_05220 [Mangrovactinospora gilvigrisea]
MILLWTGAALAWLVVITRPQFSDCFGIGGACNPHLDELFDAAGWLFWSSQAAGIVAVALSSEASRDRARIAAVVTQYSIGAATLVAIPLIAV